MKRDELYDEASKRVRMLGEFYQHLGVYLMINAGLAVYNLVIGEYWFLYSLLGWGIALVAHAASVFISGWLSYWIRMYLL